MINDYEVVIRITSLPADNKSQAELELWDILKACNQLPYEFETVIRKVGEYL